MKKTVILLILTLMMVVSGMCYAAGDGSDLNRQQAVRAVYGFDKNGKLSEFVFVPLEVKAAQK